MESLKLALQWAAAHPWWLLGSLVGIGLAIRWIGASRRSRRGRAAATPLLRSLREQRRFSHLSTIYSPKSYRRERTPKK
jgi:hypothetical protein